MPLIPAAQVPNLLELSDFTGGWSPDGLVDTTVESVLPDVQNLIIDPNTGSLATRAGFKRYLATALPVSAGTGHYARQLYAYTTAGFIQYLIVVLTNEQASADNVQLWYMKVSDPTVNGRIDTAGVTYAHPTAQWWFQAIDTVLYGGTRGATMFSWDGTTYDADASTGTYLTIVDNIGASVSESTEYARDYAYKGTEVGLYSGKYYKPEKGIRYDTWESGTIYTVGDKVSVKASADGYWTSWRCISRHTSAAATKPNQGADYADRWKKVRLALPVNDDGDVGKDWVLQPLVSKNGGSSAWFADRLWLHYDRSGSVIHRLQYSAPMKPRKDKDVPDLVWDPTDWAPGNDEEGQGGGWLPFGDGSSQHGLTALIPLGSQMLVFSRYFVKVLSGADDTSWSIRVLDDRYGAVTHKAATVLDGLVYFLSYEGLMVTDGTSVQPVEGNDKVRQYIRDRLTALYPSSTTGHGDGHIPECMAWNGYIVVSMPFFDADDDNYVTLFYDPRTQGFWKTDLPVADMVNYHRSGREELAFVTNDDYSSARLVFQYNHEEAAGLDDDGQFEYGTQAVPWWLRTAWLTFGPARQQRRIRRLWWVVKGALDYTIDQFRDWDLGAPAAEVVRTVTSEDSTHIEGNVIADSHSISASLYGEAPADIYGLAIDTEPRRLRYHT